MSFHLLHNGVQPLPVYTKGRNINDCFSYFFCLFYERMSLAFSAQSFSMHFDP